MLEMSQLKMTELLMTFFKNANEKIFIFDQYGKVIAMNKAAKLILNNDVFEQMVQGKPDAMCLTCRGYTTSEELRTCRSCYVMHKNKDLGSFQVYLDTEGKGVIPYSASYQTIDGENGNRVLMLRDLTEQIKTQQVLHQKLQINHVMKAQEDERKRISRELHDGVAQEMLSLLVDMRLMKYMTSIDDIAEKIRETEGTLMQLLEDIQHLSVELRPATLDDLGLESAFRAHFKSIEKNYGVIVHFLSDIHTQRFEGEIETAVYRICQEAVLNAVKYAGIDEMAVQLFEKENKLLLNIMDEGCGFDLNVANPEGTGLGLYGMRERAELINGSLHISTEIGEGTEVKLMIPLKKEGIDSENYNS